jgi:carbonic anhydrase/acetyltransferase-like protein (isoleucine patch superfamily)
MIRSLGDKTPRIHESAWVSEFAYVVGDIEIGQNCSVWPGVTIRADGDEPIKIGNNVNIQEGSVVHGDGLVIEDYVTIGHSVVVHGDFIGTGSLLGNNCTFLTSSTIGKECMIAANAVVLANTNIPDNSFVTGIPGTIKAPTTEKQVVRMRNTAEHLVKKAAIFKQNGL